MHHGRFPELPAGPRAGSDRYSRGSWGPDQLDPGEGPSRRWLLAAAGFAFGAAVATLIPSSIDFAGDGAPTPRPGSPDWARRMFGRPTDELLRWSGDLERAALRDPTERGFVPCFTRILDAALEARGELADPAGACAARALQQLGAAVEIRQRTRAILRRPDLVETGAAAAPALPTHDGDADGR